MASKCKRCTRSAAQLEIAVLSTRTLLVEQEKAWNDARVRECGFQVGDRVRAIYAGYGVVLEVLIDEDEALCCEIAFDGMRGTVGNIRVTGLQRIDQYGKPLPERVEGEE